MHRHETRQNLVCNGKACFSYWLISLKHHKVVARLLICRGLSNVVENWENEWVTNYFNLMTLDNTWINFSVRQSRNYLPLLILCFCCRFSMLLSMDEVYVINGDFNERLSEKWRTAPVHTGRKKLVNSNNIQIWVSVHHKSIIYRVSQEEWTKLRESVPYVKL